MNLSVPAKQHRPRRAAYLKSSSSLSQRPRPPRPAPKPPSTKVNALTRARCPHSPAKSCNPDGRGHVLVPHGEDQPACHGEAPPLAMTLSPCVHPQGPRAPGSGSTMRLGHSPLLTCHRHCVGTLSSRLGPSTLHFPRFHESPVDPGPSVGTVPWTRFSDGSEDTGNSFRSAFAHLLNTS